MDDHEPPVSPGSAKLMSASNPEELVRCWRCHKLVSLASHCVFCRAELEPPAVIRDIPEVDEEGLAATTAVAPLFWVFGILALSSVVMAYVMPEVSEFPTNNEILSTYHSIAILELIDTIIIAIGAFVVLSRVRLPWSYEGEVVKTWALAAPLLIAVLAINFGYHHVLNDVFGLGSPESMLNLQNGFTFWLILTICVQPALVEEFFFRYICLGVFEKAVGTGTAIFVSAMIFAAVHIGAMVSLPILLLIGMVLGWLRVKSGGMTLPIVFHFLHNLVVSLPQFG